MIKKEAFRGSIFILVSPSGGGKSSLIKAACAQLENLQVSVSHTTRNKRPGEKEACHYYFVSQTEFSQMIQNDEFVEYATVFGDSYGTSKRELEQKLEQGVDLILDLDWQGAKQMQALYETVTSIFILPPSVEALSIRLNARGQDKNETIQKRMDKAISEMSHYGEFDYLIINDVFEQALMELMSIIKADRLKQIRQAIKYEKLLSNLLKD